MALTLSGTNGVVGAGFTLDPSGTSVTAGVGTFSSIGAGASVTAAGLTGALPTISAASLTSIPAANIVGVATAGFERTGGYNSPSFSAYVTGTPSISGNTDTTVVFNVEDHDTDGAYNNSTGIFTVPSGKAGVYHIDAYAGIDDIADATYVRVYVQKNGTNIPGFRGQSHSAHNDRVETAGVSGTVTLAVGDQIKVNLFTNDGSGTYEMESSACRFSMFRMSV